MNFKFKLFSKLILATSMLLGIISMESRTNVSLAFDQSYFVDVDTGFAFARTASGKEPREFPGYKYVRTEVETAGSMVMHKHYYSRGGAQEPQTTKALQTASPANLVTYFVDKDGGTIYQKEGLLPPEEIEGYEFLHSFVDAQKGGASHTYKKVGDGKPKTTQTTQKVTTNSAKPAAVEGKSFIELNEIEKDNFSSIVGVYKAKNGATYKFNSDRTLEIDGKKYRLSKPYRTKSVKNNRDMITLTIRGEGESDQHAGNQFIEIFSDRIEHSFTVTPSIVIHEPGMTRVEDKSTTTSSKSSASNETTTEDSSESSLPKNSKPVGSISKNDSSQESSGNNGLIATSVFLIALGSIIYFFNRK